MSMYSPIPQYLEDQSKFTHTHTHTHTHTDTHTHYHHHQPCEWSNIFILFLYNHSLDDLLQFYGSEYYLFISDFQTSISNLHFFPELVYPTVLTSP